MSSSHQLLSFALEKKFQDVCLTHFFFIAEAHSTYQLLPLLSRTFKDAVAHKMVAAASTGNYSWYEFLEVLNFNMTVWAKIFV